MDSERPNLVKWWDHAGDVTNHKGLPWLKIQYVRRANSGIRTRKYEKLRYTWTYVIGCFYLFLAF